MYKLWKRFCAYIIDMLIIILLTQCLSSTTIFNPNLNNYQKYSKQYSNITKDYANFTYQLQKYYQDKELSEKEYNKLVKTYQSYEDTLNNYYKNNKLTEKNFNKLIKKITKNYTKESSKLYYLIEKNSLPEIMIYLIMTFLYFIGFNYITNGQTLGKKIMHLKIVMKDNSRKKVTIVSYVIRTIFMYQTIYYMIRLIGIISLGEKQYINITNLAYQLQSALEFIIIALILIRSDRRGLHDILAKTKVVSYNSNTE